MAASNDVWSDLFDQFGGEDDDDYEDIGDLDLMMNIRYQDVDEEEEMIGDDDDEEEASAQQEPMKEEEEHVLSQRLSQLSTSQHKRIHSDSLMTTETMLKKMRREEETLEESIPRYLSINNTSFKQMLEQQAWFKEKKMDMESLRPMAILMHQLSVIRLQEDLWITYVKAGTGQLMKPEGNEPMSYGPHVWPVKVKSLMLSKRITTEMPSDLEENACRTVVYEFIRDLNQKNEQYQQRLIEQKASLTEYNEVIEQSLQAYVEQQGIYLLRLKCQLKQALVNNDYQNQMFEMKYRQHNPNEEQKQLAQRLYDRKYELEKAKQRVSLLKQRVSFNQPPKSFDSLDHSLPPFIQTIEDSTVRQRLFHRHGKIIEQTKTDLIAVLIHGAEATVHQCQQQFDLEMARLWQQYRHSTSDQRLNKAMVDIIDGRLTNITERFRLISQYQTQYFFAQAPTINHI